MGSKDSKVGLYTNGTKQTENQESGDQLKEDQSTVVANIDKTVQNQDDMQGFILVTYKRKTAKIVRRNGPNEDFKCIESKVWIFIGRCSQETTPDPIKTHLNNKYLNSKFIIDDIEIRSEYKTVRIGAEQNLKDEM